MRVGVPKEIKTHEYRVGLTPGAVREYVHAGHDVVVETGAGAGIGAGDDVYRTAGARIAATAAEIFSTADMIVKVKEPQPGEWVQLRPGQILFTYLHLAADPEQARGLIASGCRLWGGGGHGGGGWRCWLTGAGAGPPGGRSRARC